MELMEAMKTRHSVRGYTDKKMEGDVLHTLRQTIADCNKDSGLNIQLCVNEPTAFTGMMARYGKFVNVKNYIALVGKKDAALDEMCGYYGEKIVLQAQQLGLNTCWVAMTFNKEKSKSAITIQPGEKLLMVIAIGYGENAGVPHKTKSLEELSNVSGQMPDWFRRGMEAAQLAPTAVNQQKFVFSLNGDTVSTTSGSGFYTKVDLGIAKYHFEIGAGDNGWKWAND